MTALLAHGTGLDDVLVFVGVVGLSLVALRLAERRARRRAEQADEVNDSLSSMPDE